MKAKSILKKTARYMLLCLLGLVILLNCVTFVLSELGLRSRLSWIPFALCRVETGSMEPELYAGDLMMIWKTPFERLQVGDTVTTVTDGTYTTHRIVRLADDEIVTMGLLNEIEDLPVGTQGYVGKKVASLRGWGDVFVALTSPAAVVLTVLCILLLFLFKPVYQWLSKKTQGLRMGLVRVLCCLTAVTAVIVPPVSTLAKFNGTVSAGKTAAAAEINFTSNYMSEDGNAYDIIGWSGDDYELDINVNNYANALKFNEEDVDLDYSIEVEKISSDAIRTYRMDYDIRIGLAGHENRPVGNTQDSSGVYQTESNITSTNGPANVTALDGSVIGTRLSYFHMAGGAKTYHTFAFLINAKEGAPGHGMALSEGDKVKFRVTAKTSTDSRYFQTISADFTMTVTTAASFIQQSILDQKPGNTVVRYTVKSATLIGVPEKKVHIQWDPELMYLNEYETTYWNMNQLGQCTYSRESGMLQYTMSATSSMRFEFFKYAAEQSTTLVQELCEVDLDGTPNSGDEYELIRIYKEGGTRPYNPEADRG